ncbi:hypothetical protein SUGI_0813230 [Cryptomeria japonica]|nr:hypothetical protein SUGI_0813230 [Cryptomeria japonica]
MVVVLSLASLDSIQQQKSLRGFATHQKNTTEIINKFLAEDNRESISGYIPVISTLKTRRHYRGGKGIALFRQKNWVLSCTSLGIRHQTGSQMIIHIVASLHETNFDFSYGEVLPLLGATVAVIGPKDVPRIARAAGRLAGKAVGYVQSARGQMETVLHQSQATQDLQVPDIDST